MGFWVWLSFSRKMPNDIWTGQRIQNVLTSYRVRHMWWNETLYKHIRLWFCFFSLCVFLLLFCLFIARSRLIDKKRGKKKWKERHEILVKIHEFMMNIIVMDAFVGVYQNACKLRKHHILVLSDIWPKSPPKRYVNGRQQQQKKTTTMTRDNQNVSKTKRTKLKWNGTHGYHAHLLSEEVTLLHCIDIC